MTIRIAKHAGFCYGVKRAVQAVEDALLNGQAVATLGPIIHNPHVVDRFSKQGVRVLSSPEEASLGELVVLRSHGVSPDVIEALAARGSEILDMACPHVANIQRIVEWRGMPRAVIVVGEKEHPEVRAIVSRAGLDVHVVANAQEAMALPQIANAVAVSQTTLRKETWDQVLPILKEKVENLEAHETICKATHDRQSEAEALSKEVEAMLIVGGPNSSNTRKLFEICARNCQSWLIQDASEIPIRDISKYKSVGITAGASTPDEIIKEVITVMSELDKIINPEPETQQPEAAQESMNPEVSPVQEAPAAEPAATGGNSIEAYEPQENDGKDSNFMTEFEKTLVSIRPGQFVTGTVVQITDDEVCVNIGYKSDGIVPRSELSSDENPRTQFKIGDEIEVEVVKVNDGEGNVLLSQKNFIVMKNWDALVEKFENNEYVDGVGKSVVKGGLICDVEGVRTFVPASQLAERYVEKIEQFIGQPMKLKIIEVDKPKRRFVASRKQVLAEEGKKTREALWGKLEEGAVVHGVVRRLTDFGAFVDIGGMDGLVHVTDLSWGRVRHPSDVVKPNDEIDVQVLGIDRERNRISLGYKQIQPKPWDNAPVNYPVGSIVEGKVVRMVTFGAFVELEPGLDGLVHISQIANQRVNKVEDVLEIGQMVNVKVLDVNPEAKRISLSIREALGAEHQPDDLDALPSDPGDVVLAHSTASDTVSEAYADAESVPAEEPAPVEEPAAEPEA